jgi:predicted enzyme related to lactoylglutathione lyase
MMQSTNLELYAGIPVSDYPSALAWYTRLFGSPPTFVATETEAGWVLAEHRTVYIVQIPERAGHAINTIIVADLDALVAQIAGRGIEPVLSESYANGWRKVTYRDSDGNEFGIGGAPYS